MVFAQCTFFFLSNSQLNTKNACLKNCLNLEQNLVNQLCKIIQPSVPLNRLPYPVQKNLLISELDFAVSDNIVLFCQAGIKRC